MATDVFLFDRLQADLAARLRAPSPRPHARRWAAAEPALGGIITALDAGVRCRDRQAPGGGRPALAALVRLAGTDRTAADAALFGVLPALRSVAAGLCRSWRADRDEVDQAVAAAGWARLAAVAGTGLGWPDRTIAEGARVAVRDGFRSRARYEGCLVGLESTTVGDGRQDDGEALVDARDVLARAVETGRVSSTAARLVWRTRALGEPAGVAGAAVGVSAKAATMACLRAERALRSTLPEAG